MDNIEDKIRNLKEWNEERVRVKPFIDVAVDCHNRARAEARWKNYEQAVHFYKEAIKNYKDALNQKPKYYLQDLLDRVDHVIEEYMHNNFDLKTSEDRLKDESGICDFVDFIDNLKDEERRYIDPYDIAQAFFSIGDFYYEIEDIGKAYDFYNRVIEAACNRPFINRDAYFKIANILFDQARFKESLVNFVSVLSFDRGNREVIACIEDCLARLGILEHKDKFLRATPNEAKKLIMEVL